MKRPMVIGMLLLFVMAMTGWAQVNRRALSSRPSGSRMNPDFYFTKPIELIDTPTANILSAGNIRGSMRLYEEGGVLMHLGVGLSTRLMMGISYGADHLIGGKEILEYKMPGVQFAYRVKEESLKGPSVVFGLDTQGYGVYQNSVPVYNARIKQYANKTVSRFSTKSKGFYLIASKNFDSFWNVNLHAGANYSLETTDGDSDPNFFGGVCLQFADDLAVLAEYDFGLNQDDLQTPAARRGTFNAGIRWAIESNFYLEFDVKNLLMDLQGNRNILRIMRLTYHSSVFSGK